MMLKMREKRRKMVIRTVNASQTMILLRIPMLNQIKRQQPILMLQKKAEEKASKKFEMMKKKKMTKFYYNIISSLPKCQQTAEISCTYDHIFLDHRNTHQLHFPSWNKNIPANKRNTHLLQKIKQTKYFVKTVFYDKNS